MRASEKRKLIKLFLLRSVLCRCQKIRKADEEGRRNKKPSIADDNRCACCLKPFVAECGINCGDCGAKICTRTCNRYDRSDDTHNCLFCYQKRCQLSRNDRWLETFGALPCDIDLHFDVNFNSDKYTAGTEHEAINRSLDSAAAGKEERNPMETIRDIIEKIVEEIVGSVNDTRIDRLYEHFAYNPSSSTDAPSMAATALREFVERAVQEARKLPALGNSATNEKQDLNVSDRSYEDLLATAILNKVIDKFQQGSIQGNGRVVAVRHKHQDDPGEGLDEVDNGSSSLEPFSQDDSNSECATYPAKCMQDYPEPLSLMIEERIEEVTTYTSDEDVQPNDDNGLAFCNTRRVPFPELGMDIVDPSQESSEDENEKDEQSHMNVISQVESWEENWLFQKKKMQARSEPVAMLVPNPSEEFRALIGDKDAEDTSDLSECCAQSDDEIEQELQEAIENVVAKDELNEKVEPKLNGVALPNGEAKSEKVNGFRASTNPFVTENRDPGKGNPFKNAALRIDLSPEVQPKTPMPTPVNDESNKFLGCDADVLCKKLDNFKNPFVSAKLDESEPEKSATVNRKTNLQSEDEAQRERECTEHYDIAIQRHVDSLRRPKMTSSNQQKIETHNSVTKVANEPTQIESSRERAEAELSHRLSPTGKINADDELSSPPRPGTIAEREHKKWENAAPIQNNPYSEENIQKRLLEKQYTRRPAELAGNNNDMPKPSDSGLTFSRNKVDIRRFSRDYYINETQKEPQNQTERRRGSSQQLSDTEQVSLGLEQFVEASLKGSLDRRTYRGFDKTTDHFVSNPLLHWEASNQPQLCPPSDPDPSNLEDDQQRLTEHSKDISTLSNKPHHQNVSNPLFENNSNQGKDSGNASLESNDDSLSSSWAYLDKGLMVTRGKKYWDIGNALHPFGGIKNRKRAQMVEMPKREKESLGFGQLKQLTFGGIKPRGNVKPAVKQHKKLGQSNEAGLSSFYSLDNLDQSGLEKRRRLALKDNVLASRSKETVKQEPKTSRRNYQRDLSRKENELRLEAPVVPEVVSRHFESLRDLRHSSLDGRTNVSNTN